MPTCYGNYKFGFKTNHWILGLGLSNILHTTFCQFKDIRNSTNMIIVPVTKKYLVNITSFFF